jgi:hypothetical protein
MVRYATSTDQQEAPGGGHSLASAADSGAPLGPPRPWHRASQGFAAEVTAMSGQIHRRHRGGNVLGCPHQADTSDPRPEEAECLFWRRHDHLEETTARRRPPSPPRAGRPATPPAARSRVRPGTSAPVGAGPAAAVRVVIGGWVERRQRAVARRPLLQERLEGTFQAAPCSSAQGSGRHRAGCVFFPRGTIGGRTGPGLFVSS